MKVPFIYLAIEKLGINFLLEQGHVPEIFEMSAISLQSLSVKRAI